MPPISRTPGLEQYVRSDAARGTELWQLEYMGELELLLGYVSQETYVELQKILARAAEAATHVAESAGNAAE
jgi:hypothetical protein